jgi:exo-1,4-beta-D-glucosaminidase
MAPDFAKTLPDRPPPSLPPPPCRRKKIPVIRKLLAASFCLLVASLTTVPAGAASPPSRALVLPLRQNWAIQSSAKATGDGAAISQAGYATQGWQPAEVPSTVLGALVRAGVYKDPFFAKNMAEIKPEPFKTSWWYRTEFKLDAGAPGDHTRLVFDGINYRANVWVNGKKVADKTALFGVWRVFDVDVTAALREGANALAVEVIPPQAGDFIMGFVDWNPLPADRNMGLYRGVSLRRSGAVSIEEPFVQTKVDLGTLKEASLTVSATLVNHGDQPMAGKLQGEIAEAGKTARIRFEAPFKLGPREKTTLRWTPAESPALHVRNPRLWWPVNLGAPALYGLELAAVVDAKPSDKQSVTFGIREVGDYLNEQGHRGYTVNGKKILIRGGGWVDDVFLREDDKKVEAQLDYVRHMNLNTIRLEGFWGASQKLYEVADRKGVLVMPGFSCEWEWDHYLLKPQDDKTYGAGKSAEEIALLTGYVHDQVVWLRNHPSVLVWVLGSDKLPWPDAERRYKAVLAEVDPTRPYLASAKSWTSTISGPTAVKMLGPYNYVTPNYWFEDRQHGGAYGFNTETGPGPQVPPLASLKRMLPPDKLWPINDVWNYHCAEHEYSDLSLFLNAFNHRYGTAKNIEEFAYKAQAANYEAMRPMFEAFGANKPRSTGVVQWMLNGAWPKLYWQLYDYYLMPTGAFYGAKKGSQPQNLVYNYADRGIYVVNDTLADLDGRTAQITVIDPEGKSVLAQRVPVKLGANAAAKIFDLPAFDGKSPMYFLDLKLRGTDGKLVSDNFYWLSVKPDVLDPDKSTEPFMPNKSFADFTALNHMPAVKVKVASSFQAGRGQVTLTNPGKQVAFFIEMQLNKGEGGEPVLPILWDDNYVSLLPGESKTIKVNFAQDGLQGAKPKLAVTGWNLE